VRPASQTWWTLNNTKRKAITMKLFLTTTLLVLALASRAYADCDIDTVKSEGDQAFNAIAVKDYATAYVYGKMAGEGATNCRDEASGDKVAILSFIAGSTYVVAALGAHGLNNPNNDANDLAAMAREDLHEYATSSVADASGLDSVRNLLKLLKKAGL